MSRLLLHTTTSANNPVFICNYCLQQFRDKTDPEEARKRMKEHEILCTPHGTQKVELPTGKYSKMYFKDYTKCHRVPYTVYADFESFLRPVSGCTREEDRWHSQDIAHHVPCSFCYVIVDRTGKAVKEPVLYRGATDVVETFLRTLRGDVNRLERDINRPFRMTEDNERDFQNATACHLCKKSIERGDEGDKVRNNDHVTGEYLEAAHNACNLNCNVPQHVPCLLYTSRCV